ncbi:MAG: helix-turn-helix transcriptional regulator [Polyangiales bacterium]
MPRPALHLARLTADLCEGALAARSRRELHDAWLDTLAPLGFDTAMVLDDTVEPGPLSTLASRHVDPTRFENARLTASEYLEDYPVLRARAARSRDVLQLTREDTWLRVFAEHGMPYGERFVLAFSLHAQATPLSVITLVRATPTARAFGRKERQVAEALAPVLSLGDLAWRARREAHEPEPAAFDVLTARQREVARLVARGLTNREIAGLVGSSENTVRNHLVAVYRKLDVSTRAELAGLR